MKAKSTPSRSSEKDKSVSVHTVARVARVSSGTVSRVMNRRGDVDPALRQRVLNISRQLGFVPKVQRQTIAVIIGRVDPFGPVGYVAAMLAALVHEFAKYDYLVEVIDAEHLATVREAHIDGALGVVFDERITTLKEIPNLPVLTINSPMQLHGIHSIATDHDQQAVLAVEHLLAHGHRRIAFLENESENWGSRQRLAGYKRALEGAGIEVDSDLIGYAFNQPLYDILGRMTRRSATAVVNFSEDYALESIHVLTNVMNRRIPQDISMVTMENIAVFRYLSPPHTVITQPLADLARIAAEELVALCRGKRRPAELVDVVLPCKLIERESVARIESNG